MSFSSLVYKNDNIMNFLSSVVGKDGLGYTPVKICPLISTMFCYTTFVTNRLSLVK